MPSLIQKIGFNSPKAKPKFTVRTLARPGKNGPDGLGKNPTQKHEFFSPFPSIEIQILDKLHTLPMKSRCTR
jgi:hypothetical protein